MKIKKGLVSRLFMMTWGAVAGITLYLVLTQDSTPEAIAYMAKVNAAKQVAVK